MNSMSRREVVALGLGSVIAGAGVRVAAGANPYDMRECAGLVPPCGSQPVYEAPPKDLRTPEQVWEDEVESQVKEILNYENPYFHYVRYVHEGIFQRLQEKLGTAAKRLVVSPLNYGLVVNGNVIVSLSQGAYRPAEPSVLARIVDDRVRRFKDGGAWQQNYYISIEDRHAIVDWFVADRRFVNTIVSDGFYGIEHDGLSLLVDRSLPQGSFVHRT
jgi:hypothetical protein